MDCFDTQGVLNLGMCDIGHEQKENRRILQLCGPPTLCTTTTDVAIGINVVATPEEALGLSRQRVCHAQACVELPCDTAIAPGSTSKYVFDGQDPSRRLPPVGPPKSNKADCTVPLVALASCHMQFLCRHHPLPQPWRTWVECCQRPGGGCLSRRDPCFPDQSFTSGSCVESCSNSGIT